MTARACVDCLAIIPITEGRRCPDCRRKMERTRYRRPGRALLFSRAWRKLRQRAVKAQPYCSDCGTSLDLTGDHIFPRRHGGTNRRSNVTVRCRSCNSRRGAPNEGGAR